MALKNIMLHMDNSPGCATRLDLAIRIAARHGAHLQGLYVRSHSYYAPRHGSNEESETAMVQAAFETASAAAGISAEWLFVDWSVVGVSITEIITIHAYYTDLLIIGQPDPQSQSGIPADFPERLGLGIGRPLLVVPYAGAFTESGGRLMIAWRAGRESVRALNDALPFLEKAEHVSVVSVGNSGTTDHAGTEGDRICAHLARHGVTALYEHIQAPAGFPVGDLLLNHACEQKMDILVMGGYAQTRRGAFVLGPVAGHLLAHMTLPVLLSH